MKGNSMENKVEIVDKAIQLSTMDAIVSKGRYIDGTLWYTVQEVVEGFGLAQRTVEESFTEWNDKQKPGSNRTARQLRVVRFEGEREVSRDVKICPLPAIYRLGYRSNSELADIFQEKASAVLESFQIKGYALDSNRLKDGRGQWEELIREVQIIRTSERNLYTKVRDIFKVCSTDYNSKSEAAKNFYSTLQNKLLFLATGNTAAELLWYRFDPTKPNHGLITWAGDYPVESDFEVAKNYLLEKELTLINKFSEGFLIEAAIRIDDYQKKTMVEWSTVLDNYIRHMDRNVLEGKGKRTHTGAIARIKKLLIKFPLNNIAPIKVIGA